MNNNNYYEEINLINSYNKDDLYNKCSLMNNSNLNFSSPLGISVQYKKEYLTFLCNINKNTYIVNYNMDNNEKQIRKNVPLYYR